MAMKNALPVEVKATQTKVSPYEEVMRQRWAATLSTLPVVDKQDIRKEVPLVNGNQVKPVESRHQHAAEFTQSSYLRIRQLEESYLMFNYFDPVHNPRFQKYLDGIELENSSLNQRLQSSLQKKKRSHLVSQFDRSYAVQKIFDLHNRKEYKIETLFVAVSIFDRFLAAIGHWTFPRDQVCLLATTSLLMAAKMEQPISPSFLRMVQLLTDEEQKQVSKDSLIDLEARIIQTLGFDFGFPGPI
jgi:hypothetical protein